MIRLASPAPTRGATIWPMHSLGQRCSTMTERTPAPTTRCTRSRLTPVRAAELRIRFIRRLTRLVATSSRTFPVPSLPLSTVSLMLGTRARRVRRFPLRTTRRSRLRGSCSPIPSLGASTATRRTRRTPMGRRPPLQARPTRHLTTSIPMPLTGGLRMWPPLKATRPIRRSTTRPPIRGGRQTGRGTWISPLQALD